MNNFFSIRESARSIKEIGHLFIELWDEIVTDYISIDEKGYSVSPIIVNDNHRFMVHYAFVVHLIKGSTILNFNGAEQGWLVEFCFNITIHDYEQAIESTRFDLVQAFKGTGLDVISFRTFENSSNVDHKTIFVQSFLNQEEWPGLVESWANQLIIKEMFRNDTVAVPDFEE